MFPSSNADRSPQGAFRPPGALLAWRPVCVRLRHRVWRGEFRGVSVAVSGTSSRVDSVGGPCGEGVRRIDVRGGIYRLQRPVRAVASGAMAIWRSGMIRGEEALGECWSGRAGEEAGECCSGRADVVWGGTCEKRANDIWDVVVCRARENECK